LWVNEARILAFARGGAERADKYAQAWGKPRVQGLEPVWTADVKESKAVALATNALVVAAKDRVLALDLTRGRELWTRPLPVPPVNWGLAVEREGSVFVVLEDGRVLCFGDR
jgi:outer membrane protein assembly factor BamB